MTKKFIYLPSGYKRRKNTVVAGQAVTGQVSPKGLVAHTEDWDGRIASTAAPSAIRYIKEASGHIRPMTMPEMIERGYFLVSSGPAGVRRIAQGIRWTR